MIAHVSRYSVYRYISSSCKTLLLFLCNGKDVFLYPIKPHLEEMNVWMPYAINIWH